MTTTPVIPGLSIRPRGGQLLMRLVPAAVLYAAGLATCTFLAYWIMFSQFQYYDDEGFFEYSLKMFMSGHPLYSSVYSEYGPFYYLFFGALLKIIGVQISTNTGRIIQLVVWISSCFGFGVAVHKITGRMWPGLLTMVGSFCLLNQLQNEPMHAAGMVCWLTAAMALVIAFGLERWRRAGPALLGALAGALMLTKVNLGGYAVVAIAFGVVMAGPLWLRRRPLLLVMAAALPVVSFAVMKSELSQRWALQYATLVTLSALALAVTAWPRREDPSAGRIDASLPRWLLAGFASAVLIVLAVVIGLGTGVGAMIRETIITPANQRALLILPFGTQMLSVYAGISGVFVAALLRNRWASIVASRNGLALTGLVRLAAGVLAFLPMMNLYPFRSAQYPYLLAWSLVWVVALPATRPERPAWRLERVLLAALAISQSLEAYPVAGSQVRLGGLLFVPCAALCIADGGSDLIGWVASHAVVKTSAAIASTALVASLAVWTFVTNVTKPMSGLHAYWASQPALAIGNADLLRLNPAQAEPIEDVVASVRSHCSTLMELPGLYSFNLWSGLPTPSPLGGEQPYWGTLNSAQQRQVLKAARASPRLCVIEDPSDAGLYLGSNPIPRGILVDYLTDDFRPIGTYGAYTVTVRKR